MKTRFPRLMLLCLLCAALLLPTFALAEETALDMEPIEACEHVNTYPKVDSQFVNATIEGVEDPVHQHKAHYENYLRAYCEDCGTFLSAGSPQEDTYEVQDHVFDDEGKCVDCGYQCQHPETYPDWELANRAVENVNDANDHRVTGTRIDYNYCPICGMQFNRTESAYEQMEEHWFNGDTVCDECGYTCTHPGSTYVEYNYSDKTYVNVGSRTRHKVAGTRTVRIRCGKCSTVLSESTADASYFADHDFNDKGVCVNCGYGCPHEHVHTETDSDFADDEDDVYKDTGDNKTHLRIRKVKQYTYCDDCYCKVGEVKEVTLEENVGHYYGSNGICEQCGHANTCTHPNRESRKYDTLDVKYEKYDSEEFHHYTYTVEYRDFCPDCDMWLGEETARKEPVTEDRVHTFNNRGVCYGCGYVKNCTHPNAFDREGGRSDRTTYEDTGSNATHLCCMDGWTEKYCPDCAKWLGNEQPFTVKNEEYHDYDANGVCVLCGHKNACEHKRTTKFDQFKTTSGYTPVDENNHTRNGLKQTVLYCDDCHTVIEVLSSFESSETEGHDFDWNNVCRKCGYQTKCQHANIAKDYGGWFEEIDSCKYIDGNTHRVAGWYYTYDFCLDCGQHYDDYSVYKIKTEAHSFNDKGVCHGCGYKRECAHENLSGWTMYSTGRATYKNIGHRLVHEATPVLSRRVYCEDCGKLIEDEIIASGETALLYHNYDANGVCKDCGYVSDSSTCAHANTETNIYFRGDEYAKDTGSDATHEVLGRQMVTQVYCKDCERVISETTKAFGHMTMSHNYDHGICTQCGHVNKCAHANTETKTTILGKIKDTGSNSTHQVSGYKFETVICKDCGMRISSKLVSKDATENVAHKYVDDLCVVCGHKKTEEKAAVQPAETEEEAEEEAKAEAPAKIVYETVSDDTVVNGVKVADELPMAEALETVGKTLDEEIASGENVTVDIVGIDKVLNKEEKAKLDKLPVKDRMLVVLNALGLGDAIGEEAMAGMSEEAKALTEEVSARLEGMSDAEKQALLDTIAQFFPKTKVTIDGKEFDAFSIDVVIDRDGKKEYDRYTFYNDGAQWMLYSIEVGKLVEETAA